MAAVKVLVLWGLCVSSVISSPSSVPAVIWTNNQMHKFPSTLAGHSTSGDVFADYISTSLADKKQNLVVFLQDKLNVEDLSQHADGDTFKNLKSLVGSQVSAHLSGVNTPADVLAKLRQQFAGRVHEVTPSTNVGNLPMSNEGHDMLVVNLPPTEKGQIEDTLKNSDSIIGSVISKLQSAGKKYTAVYTAKDSSQVVDETLYMGRHLLAEEEKSTANDTNKATFLNVSGCIFFYANKIILHVKKHDMMFTLPGYINTTYTNGACEENNNTWLELTYPDDLPEGLEDFSLRMNFEKKNFEWKSTDMVLSFKVYNSSSNDTEGMKNVTETYTMSADFLFAPKGHCYHCGVSKELKHDTNSTNSTTTVIFQGMQVQIGDILKNKFGRSNDCIGFFTIPIWSGLIVGLLLVSILFFGVVMLLMMNSIDRFDDPKGKTITVNVTD